MVDAEKIGRAMAMRGTSVRLKKLYNKNIYNRYTTEDVFHVVGRDALGSEVRPASSSVKLTLRAQHIPLDQSLSRPLA